MQFTVEIYSGIPVLHLRGKIMGDVETKRVCSRLDELIEAGMLSMVLDFQNVQLLNSAGIGAIIACLNTVRQQGGDLRFANVHDAVQHYFHITKIETVVKIFASVDEAVASFAGMGERQL